MEKNNLKQEIDKILDSHFKAGSVPADYVGRRKLLNLFHSWANQEETKRGGEFKIKAISKDISKTKRKTKIRIVAVDKRDKKRAKVLEKLANERWNIYAPVVERVVDTRFYLETVYLIKTPDDIWERIIEEVVKLDMERELENEKRP